jgi:hyperosmotically inducible protein
MSVYLCLAIASLALLMPGCQTSVDDTITKSVKETLVEDRQMNLVRVDVETQRGAVYLNGEVDTAEHKIRAEQLAKRVQGVKEVINQLKVHD